MTKAIKPIQHIHKRKIKHKELQEYPHPNKLKRFFDSSIYIIGCLGPMFGSIQSYKIYSNKSASDISLIAFGFNSFANIWWIIYGILHKEKPIIMVNILWVIVNLSIVTGVLIYR